MPFRVEPDDDVGRFHSAWLGPPGYTLPWTARYIAYTTFAVIFAGIVLFKWVTPYEVATPPVWEISMSILGASIIMAAVDHDKPVTAVIRSAVTAYTAALTRRRAPRPTHPVARRVKITREPL